MSDNKYNNVMHLGNPTNTIAVLNRYGFDFKKKFGQNFLIDENVVEKIVREAGVTKDDFVVEVGPGIGTMTQILCENAREVVAVEIDKKLIPILTEDTLSYYDNVTVINEDILKLDIKKLADEKNGGRPIKVVANLPYYITTPIVMKFLEEDIPVTDIVVMVQKEVGDRFKARVGSEDYNALSIIVQYLYDVKQEMNVSKAVFYPSPKVDSVVISFTPKFKRNFEYEKGLFEFIENCFKNRRKTLNNNLKQFLDVDTIGRIYSTLNLKESVRAQELDLDTFIRMYGVSVNED